MEKADQKQNLELQNLKTNQEFMREQFNDLKTEMRKGFSDIKSEIKSNQKEVRENYVSKDEFRPVKLISYGLVGAMLTLLLFILESFL